MFKNYREYNRLLRNQVLLAEALKAIATNIHGPNSEAAIICTQIIDEADAFDNESNRLHQRDLDNNFR